jgi:predicted Zn finger-like uncharacterized protein
VPAVTCPHCKQRLAVTESQVGMKLRCAKCSKPFRLKWNPRRPAPVNHDDSAGFNLLSPQSPALPSNAPPLPSIPVQKVGEMLNDAEERLSRPISPALAVEWRPVATPAVRAPVPDTQEHSSQQETREIGVPPLATQVNVVIQQPNQRPRKGIHYVHLLLTVVTGGGWLPIWVLIWSGGVFPFSSEVTRLVLEGLRHRGQGTTPAPQLGTRHGANLKRRRPTPRTDHWPNLPEPIRRAMLALVESAAKAM